MPGPGIELDVQIERGLHKAEGDDRTPRLKEARLFEFDSETVKHRKPVSDDKAQGRAVGLATDLFEAVLPGDFAASMLEQMSERGQRDAVSDSRLYVELDCRTV